MRWAKTNFGRCAAVFWDFPLTTSTQTLSISHTHSLTTLTNVWDYELKFYGYRVKTLTLCITIPLTPPSQSQQLPSLVIPGTNLSSLSIVSWSDYICDYYLFSLSVDQSWYLGISWSNDEMNISCDWQLRCTTCSLSLNSWFLVYGSHHMIVVFVNCQFNCKSCIWLVGQMIFW